MPPSQYRRAQQHGMWIPSNSKRKPLHKRISSASNFHEIAPEKPKKRVIHFRRFSQPTLYGPGRRSNPQTRLGSVPKEKRRSLNKKDPLYKIKSKHRRIVSNGHSFSGGSEFGDPRPYQNLMYKDPTHTPDPFDEFGDTPDLHTKSRRFKNSHIAMPAPVKMDGFKTRRFSAPTQPYLEEVAKSERTFQSKLTFDSRRKRRDQQIKQKKKLAKIFYEKEGEQQPGFVQPTVGGVLTASAEHSCSHSRSPVSSSTPCDFEGEPGALPPSIHSLRLAAELAGQETRTRRREKYITRFGEQRCRTILTF